MWKMDSIQTSFIISSSSSSSSSSRSSSSSSSSSSSNSSICVFRQTSVFAWNSLYCQTIPGCLHLIVSHSVGEPETKLGNGTARARTVTRKRQRDYNYVYKKKCVCREVHCVLRYRCVDLWGNIHEGCDHVFVLRSAVVTSGSIRWLLIQSGDYFTINGFGGVSGLNKTCSLYWLFFIIEFVSQCIHKQTFAVKL